MILQRINEKNKFAMLQKVRDCLSISVMVYVFEYFCVCVCVEGSGWAGKVAEICCAVFPLVIITLLRTSCTIENVQLI